MGKVRDKDVGRRMQVALVVTADEFPIAGEGHVAFEDAGAHARARLVAFLGVFGELQRRATAVADREVGLMEGRAGRALLEFFLEAALVHFIDEIERARTKLHVLPLSVVIVPFHLLFLSGHVHGENR